MNIHNQLIEFAQKHGLMKKALAHIDMVMDEAIASDKENGLDLLNGHDRAELIYEFGSYLFQMDENCSYNIITRILIYSKKLYGSNFNVPIGLYDEWTDSEGEHLDEFLELDWSPITFDTEYHIGQLSKVVPPTYFRRNVPEFEFATYVNHVLFLVQGRKFDEAVLFIKICLDYLENGENKAIETEYLGKCLELFLDIHYFIKNKKLMNAYRLSLYRIPERSSPFRPKR